VHKVRTGDYERWLLAFYVTIEFLDFGLIGKRKKANRSAVGWQGWVHLTWTSTTMVQVSINSIRHHSRWHNRSSGTHTIDTDLDGCTAGDSKLSAK
jgi:hypothetical protein